MPTHYSEYDIMYESTPEQKKRRVKRNSARRAAIREGRARKGDDTDVHHPDRNLNGRTKVIPRGKNRSIK